ncbi:hypothetical protein OIU76_014322 [Salix suchowensis]|nr:hypothetical protein OIU76_014322 [Salix suchowensis]
MNINNSVKTIIFKNKMFVMLNVLNLICICLIFSLYNP